MKWYWWALIALGVILIIWGIVRVSKKQSTTLATNGGGTIFNPYELIPIT